MFTNFFIEFPRFIPGGDSPLNRYISRSVEINITGFSDWGLGIGDAWIGKPYPVTSHQSLVPNTRQLVFNGSLAT